MSRMVSVMSRMVSVMSRTGLVMSCTLGLHDLKGFRLFRRQDFFYFRHVLFRHLLHFVPVTVTDLFHFRTVRLYGFLPFLGQAGS